MNSFIDKWGPAIQGKSDPAEFAKALQDTGGFGVYENGDKVPSYVSGLAGTIRGLRSIIGDKDL